MFPYIAIVQSSGFGKCRLLKELAIRTNRHSDHMRVVYVCIRTGDSSGYPEKTCSWPNHLFPSEPTARAEESLRDLLVALFHNAIAEWDSVGETCFTNFSQPTSGKQTSRVLAEAP